MTTATRSMAHPARQVPEQRDGALQRCAPDERRAPNVLDLLESGLVDYIISTSPHGRDPHRDSVKFRRKATELSIPTITAMDTARVLVDALRGDHDISQMELVDIANLHREAANGK